MFEIPCQHFFWNEKKDRKWGKDNKNTAGSLRWEETVSALSCENTLSAYFEYNSPHLWGELRSATASVHLHEHFDSHFEVM